MMRTQGGPPSCKDEYSLTDNQDSLTDGLNKSEGGQMSCAAYASNMQSMSNTKENTSQELSSRQWTMVPEEVIV